MTMVFAAYPVDAPVAPFTLMSAVAVNHALAQDALEFQEVTQEFGVRHRVFHMTLRRTRTGGCSSDRPTCLRGGNLFGELHEVRDRLDGAG
jgi:hypothetical protein